MKISEERFDVLQRFITWREKHIKDKQFILILSLLVGVFIFGLSGSGYTPYELVHPEGGAR